MSSFRSSLIAAARLLACLVLGLGSVATPALAQPGGDPSGIDFVTIGAVGNRGYDGPDPNGLATGRGRVDYEYKIGRYEVTAGQWGEFFDAALNRPDPIPFVRAPLEIGPGSMGAVGGITWRTAAIYCNWLHNNKSLDRAAFMSGAYDVATFGFTPEGVFTDQAAHSPGGWRGTVVLLRRVTEVGFATSVQGVLHSGRTGCFRATAVAGL